MNDRTISTQAADQQAQAYVKEAKAASLRWIKALRDFEPDTNWNFDEKFHDYAHAATIIHGLRALVGLNHPSLEKALREATIKNAIHWSNFSAESIATMLAESEQFSTDGNQDEACAKQLTEAVLHFSGHPLKTADDNRHQVRHVLFHHEAIMCWKNIEMSDEEFAKTQALEKLLDEMTNTNEQKPTNTPWWVWMCLGAFVLWLISSF